MLLSSSYFSLFSSVSSTPRRYHLHWAYRADWITETFRCEQVWLVFGPHVDEPCSRATLYYRVFAMNCNEWLEPHNGFSIAFNSLVFFILDSLLFSMVSHSRYSPIPDSLFRPPIVSGANSQRNHTISCAIRNISHILPDRADLNRQFYQRFHGYFRYGEIAFWPAILVWPKERWKCVGELLKWFTFKRLICAWDPKDTDETWKRSKN